MALCKVRCLVGALLLATTLPMRIKQVSQMPHMPEEKQLTHLATKKTSKHMERANEREKGKKERANERENVAYLKKMKDDLVADKTMGKMPGHGKVELAQAAGPEVAKGKGDGDAGHAEDKARQKARQKAKAEKANEPNQIRIMQKMPGQVQEKLVEAAGPEVAKGKGDAETRHAKDKATRKVKKENAKQPNQTINRTTEKMPGPVREELLKAAGPEVAKGKGDGDTRHENDKAWLKAKKENAEQNQKINLTLVKMSGPVQEELLKAAGPEVAKGKGNGDTRHAKDKAQHQAKKGNAKESRQIINWAVEKMREPVQKELVKAAGPVPGLFARSVGSGPDSSMLPHPHSLLRPPSSLIPPEAAKGKVDGDARHPMRW